MRGNSTKWWGWGAEGKETELSPGALEMLGTQLGEADPNPVVDRARVRLPAAAKIPGSIERTVGPDNVHTGDEERLRHCVGMSYPDLIRLRSGEIEHAPDAVVTPLEHEQVLALLGVCADKAVAVVPFGGGTSVVGGVEPDRGGFERVIALDLARMRECEVDERSLLARLGPGLTGPEAEAELAKSGVTLGHY